MNVRSMSSAAVALAIVCAASAAVLAGPASAAPAGKEGMAYQVSLSAEGGVGVAEATRARGAVEERLGAPLVMSGRTRAGVNTVITCYVSGSGPASNGSVVSFVIGIDCVGGVPRQLFVDQNIARYSTGGGYVIEPDSMETCVEDNSPVLFCYSETRCFQAGASYDGFARIFGVDENGVLHEAAYYAPPRYLGCTI